MYGITEQKLSKRYYMVANNEELEINQYISIIEQKTMLFDLLSKLFLLAYHQNLHKARTSRTR